MKKDKKTGHNEEIDLQRRSALAKLGLVATAVYAAPALMTLSQSAHAVSKPSAPEKVSIPSSPEKVSIPSKPSLPSKPSEVSKPSVPSKPSEPSKASAPSSPTT